ncbi:sulfatase family protein [Microlunatus sp. Y2014]|uniref:sulfatase family protein n=1 Tax=Microlunatus sp. Y2014 TaxID=3418488 RepID=UPI003DA75787
MPDRPNVLLITTDQQRYDTLACHGNQQVATPHLDALAARGTDFRRGYIQNPVCMPSRACIQTGRYVFQHGVEYMEDVIGSTPGLPPWEPTLAERLHDVGYHTAAFGKIHMKPPRGYDELQLTMGKGARWRQAEGSPLGPAQLGPNYAAWLESKRPGAYASIYAQRRTPEYAAARGALPNVLAADECVDHWIAENTCEFLARDHEDPFFLWTGFCGPHGPFDPPEPYASRYDPDALTLSDLAWASQSGLASQYAHQFPGEEGEALLRRMTALYWGMVSYLDDQVGRISDVLTRQGLWENTIVIFTSDHGEMLGDFGRTGKASFLESVIRVPYLVAAPSGRPGQTVDALVEHIDLAPTVLDLVGLPQPPALPGRSLRPLLEGAPVAEDWHRPVLCEFTSNDRQHRSKCLRTTDRKYVFHDDRAPELYDLATDPTELHNVAADPAYASDLAELQTALLERLTAGAPNDWTTGAAAAAVEELDDFGRRVT